MPDPHAAYYQRVYPGIWREKLKRYGRTDYHRRMTDLLGGLVGRIPDPRILEVAIGTGVPIAMGLPGRIWGIDIAGDLLKECRANLPRAGLIQAQAERLPFRSDAFDLVYCLQSSWCLQDVEPVLAEMVRVARPGGACVMDLMNAYSPRIALTQWAMRMRSWTTPGLEGYMRQRASDPWKAARFAARVGSVSLRSAEALDREPSWKDWAQPRFVLAIRKHGS